MHLVLHGQALDWQMAYHTILEVKWALFISFYTHLQLVTLFLVGLWPKNDLSTNGALDHNPFIRRGSAVKSFL